MKDVSSMGQFFATPRPTVLEMILLHEPDDDRYIS
jgi:hypothetical protein